MKKTEIPVPTVRISVSVRATNTPITNFTTRLYVYALSGPPNDAAISLPVGPAPGETSVTIRTNTNVSTNNGLGVYLEVNDTSWGISFIEHLGAVTEDQDIVFVLVEKS